MSIKALQGDCLEVMKTLPDKSIDLFICDLPYGCLSSKTIVLPPKKYVGNHGVSTITGCDWDIKIDLDKFWEQVERLMKNEHTPIIQFCNAKFGYDLIKSKESWFRYDLVWNKMRGVSFLSANKMPMKSHELIYVFAKKGAKYYRKDIKTDKGAWKLTGKGADRTARQYNIKQENEGMREGGKEGMRCVLSVINNGTSQEKGGHPTAKPIDLYKFLIERYSKEGDMVLDPTFGSGNSGRACAELNRHYIGIEKDEKFFNAYQSSSCSPHTD